MEHLFCTVAVPADAFQIPINPSDERFGYLLCLPRTESCAPPLSWARGQQVEQQQILYRAVTHLTKQGHRPLGTHLQGSGSAMAFW